MSRLEFKTNWLRRFGVGVLVRNDAVPVAVRIRIASGAGGTADAVPIADVVHALHAPDLEGVEMSGLKRHLVGTGEVVVDEALAGESRDR
jgi:hypothetical protein